MLHPSLTHLATLAETMEEAMSKLTLTEMQPSMYHSKLSDFDPIKKKHFGELKVHPFHISVENNDIQINAKKYNTKVLSVQTSTSTSELFTALILDSLSKGGLAMFISLTISIKEGREDVHRFLQMHKMTVN